MQNIKIIAEAGINHNGELDLAKKMILAAKAAGADAIKFQTFKTEEFVANKSQMFTYKSQGKEVTESMFEMFKRYEFEDSEWREVIGFCKEQKIEFASTCQNPSDMERLLTMTDLPFIKVGSDDLTNLEIMEYYACKNIPMIISAGMAYASEIEDAVEVIRKVNNKPLTVLHCIASYPTPAAEVNMRKMQSIKMAFDVNVGFSDHTEGNTAAIGAVCLGATVIEKHFTLDHELPGPDHWFSITSEGLKSYVKDIRDMQMALGSSRLIPTHREFDMRNMARRKITTTRDIEAGEILKRDDFEFKRAEDPRGLAPKFARFLINQKVKKPIKAHEVIALEDLGNS